MRHDYKKQYKNTLVRQLEEKDLEFLRKWRNNPKNTKYLRKISYITSDMQNDWYYSYLENETEVMFAIDEICELHQVVGSMALYNIEGNQAEVGKFLIGEPKVHGLNVGSNALRAVMAIAKDELKLKTLYLNVYKDNIPANIVYKRAGFKIVSEHILDMGIIEYTMSIDL